MTLLQLLDLAHWLREKAWEIFGVALAMRRPAQSNLFLILNVGISQMWRAIFHGVIHWFSEVSKLKIKFRTIGFLKILWEG